VLLNRSTLDVLSLESLGLPRWWLSISWNGWLEMRWRKRAGERISSEIRVLPSQSGMIYNTIHILLLLFFLEDSLQSFLVWAIV
jgi:hypothetical protein